VEIQHELAELSRTAGPQVFDEAEPFRAAVDDFLSSESITTGELNLLVDAVRLRGFARLTEMLDRGAAPAAALDAAAEQLARDRGTTEVAGAGWALAVLGFAVGRVGEDQVRSRRTAMTAGPGAAAAPAAMTLPRQPPLPPQPQTQPQPRAAATVPPPPPVAAHPVAPLPVRAQPIPALPPLPPRRRRTGLVVGLAALVVLVLAAGGAGVAVLLRTLGDDDGPTTARSGPGTSTPTSSSTDTGPRGNDESSEPGDGADDPLGIGYPLHDLACGSGFIVVLTSSEGPTPAATAGDALDRFPRAEGRAYLEPGRSCSNLSRLTNKVNLSVVPYLGPFPDAVSACEARMASTDTTTYVIGVAEEATAATYCACSYDAADLPSLDEGDDAEPVGNDRFWTLELQYMLWEAGYNPDKLVPGRFGEQTAAFVRALQADNGLTTTGAIDPATWSALQDRVCP
jgi:peptidoglycan hydrolase-like protein with peptidoglycan-binding domain